MLQLYLPYTILLNILFKKSQGSLQYSLVSTRNSNARSQKDNYTHAFFKTELVLAISRPETRTQGLEASVHDPDKIPHLMHLGYIVNP